jgi:hypothetical protein
MSEDRKLPTTVPNSNGVACNLSIHIDVTPTNYRGTPPHALGAVISALVSEVKLVDQVFASAKKLEVRSLIPNDAEPLVLERHRDKLRKLAQHAWDEALAWNAINGALCDHAAPKVDEPPPEGCERPKAKVSARKSGETLDKIAQRAYAEFNEALFDSVRPKAKVANVEITKPETKQIFEGHDITLFIDGVAIDCDRIVLTQDSKRTIVSAHKSGETVEAFYAHTGVVAGPKSYTYGRLSTYAECDRVLTEIIAHHMDPKGPDVDVESLKRSLARHWLGRTAAVIDCTCSKLPAEGCDHESSCEACMAIAVVQDVIRSRVGAYYPESDEAFRTRCLLILNSAPTVNEAKMVEMRRSFHEATGFALDRLARNALTLSRGRF